MIPLSPETSRRLEALFPAGQRLAAAKLLLERCSESLPITCSADDEFWDRIRFAVLKLSNGDLKRLRHEIDGANLDWRDTLMAAGFGLDEHAHRSWLPHPPAGSA